MAPDISCAPRNTRPLASIPAAIPVPTAKKMALFTFSAAPDHASPKIQHTRSESTVTTVFLSHTFSIFDFRGYSSHPGILGHQTVPCS